MKQIQFLQTTSQQLESKINVRVKIILEDFLKKIKSKKRKRHLSRRGDEKLAKDILSIVRIVTALIHLIEPSSLQNNHSGIITFVLQVIILFMRTQEKLRFL